MTHKPIFVTQTDLEKVRGLLLDLDNSGYRGSMYVRKLRAELARAEIIPLNQIPDDLIQLNTSAILRDIHSGEEMHLTLVLPDEADLEQNKISILAPIGAAMLGYRVGDVFEWETPEGMRTLRVERILSAPTEKTE